MNSALPAALTINEACEYIRVSRATLYRLFRDGDLAICRIGGKSLVRRQDADALLEKGLARKRAEFSRGRRPVTSGRPRQATVDIFG